MRRMILVAGLVAVCALPAAALAHTKAHGKTRHAVLNAVVHQKQLSRAQARCVIVIVSTVNRAFAAVTFPGTPKGACLRVAANGVIIEHRVHGRWRFVTVGSDMRCPIHGVPNRVSRDLGVCS